MPDRNRPNILIATCHDLGRHLGCYGVQTVHTPHIDALAADGVRFTRAFCTAPQCSCSRASMFTGRYPHATGVMGLTHGDFGWDMHPDERLIGQALRAAGYATLLFGIHHETRHGRVEEVAARCGMDEVVPPLPAEALVDAALERLGRLATGERPFYMQLGFHEPHRIAGPDDPPGAMGFVGDYIRPDESLGIDVPPYLVDDPGARRETAELQGAIRYMDAAVGRLLAGLQRLRLAQNTLVVLTTDHGIAMPRAKCTLYDPGIEVALILRLPARGWRGGRVVAPLVSNVDLFPTWLELAGLPPDERVHGRSLAPLLDADRAYVERDAVFGELTWHDYYDPRRSIRTARHKLIVNFSTSPSFMDPTQSWQPHVRPRVPADPAAAYHPPVELYDLEADPHEWNNLAGDPAQAEIQRDLSDRLLAWMRDTADPLLHDDVTSPSHQRARSALGISVDRRP